MEKQCQICSKEFSFLFQSRNKCKRCQLIVCNNCLKYSFKISPNLLKSLKMEKVCGQCRSDCKFQEELRMEIKCNWNTVSLFQDSIYGQNAEQQYKKSKELSKCLISGSVHSEQIKNDLIKGFIGSEIFNYSFQDWIGYSICKVNRKIVFDDISDLIMAFLYKNPGIGYSQDLFMIAVVLLTLMKDYAAFNFLEQIYQTMPNEYWPINELGYDKNLKQYLQDYQLAFKIDPMQLPLLKKFMEFYTLSSIQSLFIKVLNFSCFYNILEEYISKQNSFNEILRHILIIAKLNIRTLNKLGMDYKVITRELLRKTDYKCIIIIIIAIRQIKELLDHKMDQNPIYLATPSCSVQVSRQNSFVNIIDSPSINEHSFTNNSNVNSSQKEINIEEDTFVFTFQNEQNSQILKLSEMVEQKKKELQELQNNNRELKMKWQSKRKQTQFTNQEYISKVDMMVEEICREMKDYLQLLNKQ